MAEYALIDPDGAVNRTATNVDPTVKTRTGWKWLPVIRSTSGSGSVSDPAVTTVLADEVTIVTPLRDPTPEEVAAQLDEIASQFDGMTDLTRAAVLVIMDELNRHSTLETSILAAAAAATSLADFKTRMGAINALPQRTAADLRQAIRNKLGN